MGFRVWGSGLRVEGSRFRGKGMLLRVLGPHPGEQIVRVLVLDSGDERWSESLQRDLA
jgi:hypothetical protein